MVTTRLRWASSYRLIAARLPRLDIFEAVTDPADLDAVLELEALTNPRLRETLGPIQRIPAADRAVGPGSAFIMAAFAYPRPARFSDDEHGAYYAARSLDTAVAEVSFHRARFAALTATPAMDFDERIVEAAVAGTVADLRGLPDNSPVYDPDPARYGAAQAEAARLRAQNAAGIVYRSVRDPGGTCVAAFTPRLIRNAHTTGYIGLRWDGRTITDAYRKDALGRDYPSSFEDDFQ